MAEGGGLLYEAEIRLGHQTLLRSGETLTEADRARVLAASLVEWSFDFPKVSTRALRMARNLDDSRPAAALTRHAVCRERLSLPAPVPRIESTRSSKRPTVLQTPYRPLCGQSTPMR